MNDVVIASNPSDSRAAAAVGRHHAHLAGAWQLRAEAVVSAGPQDWQDARNDLVAWSRRELLPHAAAEERTLYAAARARPEGRLLIDAMVDEHELITRLVQELAAATTSLAAATRAHALRVVLDSHVAKEDTLVLPLLVSAPEVSVSELLEGMHDLIGDADEGRGMAPTRSSSDEGSSDEGSSDEDERTDPQRYPQLDARAVPHAIRHATIFGALEAVAPGGGLVLVAPHDPKPLLAQVAQRYPGVFAVEYLDRGPQAWRLAFTRGAA